MVKIEAPSQLAELARLELREARGTVLAAQGGQTDKRRRMFGNAIDCVPVYTNADDDADVDVAAADVAHQARTAFSAVHAKKERPRVCVHVCLLSLSHPQPSSQSLSFSLFLCVRARTCVCVAYSCVYIEFVLLSSSSYIHFAIRPRYKLSVRRDFAVRSVLCVILVIDRSTVDRSRVDDSSESSIGSSFSKESVKLKEKSFRMKSQGMRD